MQQEVSWKNWPILLIGVILVAGLLIAAGVVLNNHVLSNYLEDIAGAITAVVLSIATYDEWERRRERRRYRPPEQMGTRRIRDEVFQLLYQYAFVLTLRWDPTSEAMRTVESVTADKEFTEPETELHAKSAKHISQENPRIKNNLFKVASQALAHPQFTKQQYKDVNELILQTERAIEQIDMAIAVYGYSFTPEVHKWALEIRERLSQSITGKLPVLSIRLTAASRDAQKRLRKADIVGLQSVIRELIQVGERAWLVT